ncbi:MAG: HAMP domain-containing sensor histidine kinase [Cyanobacteria bacterium P01_A01_bin.3]
MTFLPSRPSGTFISLRAKLLLTFSIVFSLLFVGACYRSYRFSTERAIARLRQDMEDTLTGATAGVNVQELLALYREGEPNDEQFSDDARYHSQLAWLKLVNSIEPRAWLYTYLPTSNTATPRRVGSPASGYEVIFLVDSWSDVDANKAAKFLEPYSASEWMQESLEEGVLVQRPYSYSDAWGSWISAYAPLFDETGRVVAGMGIDIELDYVQSLRRGILLETLQWYAIAYAVLFGIVYWISGVLTKNLTSLTHSARLIGSGDYDSGVKLDASTRFPDEMNTLAEVMEATLDQIRTREQLIIEVQQTEDEMRHALEEERELNELTSRFISMVSHELRTPLTVIRTSSELLEHYGQQIATEKRQEYYHRIQGAIKTMAQLIEDVLVAGKAEAGKLKFQPVRLDVTQFCRNTLEEIRLGLQKACTITFEYHGSETFACLDPKLLHIILTNLIFNAVKYSGGDKPVNLEVFWLNEQIIFEIRDRGIGIPITDQPHMFQTFHRARNVGTIRGTGLGLAIVKHCVDYHKGQITFVSTEDVGTTFVVKLPAHAPVPIEACTTTSAETSSGETLTTESRESISEGVGLEEINLETPNASDVEVKTGPG